jgi:hypothetical protein
MISLSVPVNKYSVYRLYNRAGSNGSQCVEPSDLICLGTFCNAQFCFWWCNAMYCVESRPMFWRCMSPPSSELNTKSSRKPVWRHMWQAQPAFTLVFWVAYSSSMKIEVTCASDRLVHFQQTAWHYTSEDRSLHNHCSENLKSCILQYRLQTQHATTMYIACRNRCQFF